MATPHVAGAAALVLGDNPALTPAQVASTIIGNATTGVIGGNISGTPNRLLYVTPGASTPPPPPPPPNGAVFGKSCSGLTCTFTGNDGAWSATDGWTATGAQVSHTFASRFRGTVTHTVGSDSYAVSVTCNPKRCR